MMKMWFRRRNTVDRVSCLCELLHSILELLILEVEDEKIQRNLEKQFNEGLQSKIAHTHHGGLGFHGETPSEPQFR